MRDTVSGMGMGSGLAYRARADVPWPGGGCHWPVADRPYTPFWRMYLGMDSLVVLAYEVLSVVSAACVAVDGAVPS